MVITRLNFTSLRAYGCIKLIFYVLFRIDRKNSLVVVTHQKLHKHNNKSLQICDRSPRTAFSLPDITVVQWLINLPAHKIANNIPNDVFKWRYDVRPLLLHHPINQSVLPCTVSSRPGPMDV